MPLQIEGQVCSWLILFGIAGT